jgi:hypothetical protein
MARNRIIGEAASFMRRFGVDMVERQKNGRGRLTKLIDAHKIKGVLTGNDRELEVLAYYFANQITVYFWDAKSLTPNTFLTGLASSIETAFRSRNSEMSVREAAYPVVPGSSICRPCTGPIG